MIISTTIQDTTRWGKTEVASTNIIVSLAMLTWLVTSAPVDYPDYKNTVSTNKCQTNNYSIFNT